MNSKSILCVSALALISSTAFAVGTKTIVARPAFVDISATTSIGALKVSFSGYSAADAPKYRLYSTIYQHNGWSGSAFVTSTSYASSPTAFEYVNGNPFWIVYQRGNYNGTAPILRDRVSPYSTNTTGDVAVNTVSPATAISSAFTISGTAPANAGFTPSANNAVALAYNADGTLIAAGVVSDAAGSFSIVCPQGQTIMKVSIETANSATVVHEKTTTTGWTTTVNLETLPVSMSAFELE